MKQNCIRLFGLLSIVLGAGVVLAAESTNRRENYTDKYGPLSDHNIFMRDRTVKPTRAAPPTTQVSRTPEASLVFNGAALDVNGVDLRAYFEDTNKSEVLKLAPGDAIARGKITQIEVDSVCYERNGEQVWINIGCDLTGKQAVVVTSESTRSPTTGPSEIINPNDPNLTLEQKMKLRRLNPDMK